MLRPTRAGWCFFAITFGVGFAALNTGNNLLYLVLSLMLSFLVLSGILSESALRGIRVVRELPREIHAGRDNRVVLRITNQQPRVTAFAVVVEDRVAGASDPAVARRKRAPQWSPAGRCFALRIGPGETVACHYALRPERRGPIEFVGQSVSTRFPFGLFVKSLETSEPASALVFPAILPLGRDAAPAAPIRGSADFAGRIGHGAEVSGLREHQRSDSPRHVHWKSSLRRGALVVGETHEESDAEVEVWLRTRGVRPTDDRADFERRVVRAASQVVAHLESGLRVGLRTDGEQLTCGSGVRQRVRLLAFLARVEPDASEAVDLETVA